MFSFHIVKANVTYFVLRHVFHSLVKYYIVFGLVAQFVCSYFWLSPDCVFLCRLQHLVAQAVSYHQPVNTKMINTHVCNVVPSFQDHTPGIYMKQHTGAATLTQFMTFVERVVCLKAIADVTWHHMAYMTLKCS